MLKLKDIIGLNIEISSRCGAGCPFCSRTKKVRHYGGHLITLEDFNKLPVSLLKGLEWITFGGNFGDMSSNHEMVDIAAYVRSLNPDVIIKGYTNGTLQDEVWWESLGTMFSTGEMVFCVDGLEDTHAIHRKGTDFNRIIRNMKAFTRTGGLAHWQFIVFKHNEHQIEEARQMAIQAGCSRFFIIFSREYNETCQKPETLDVQLKSDIYQSYQEKAIQNHEFARCKPLSNGSLYIAADGTVHPCCLAHCMYITEEFESFDFIIPCIEKYHKDINFKTTLLEEIISGSYFRETLKKSKTNAFCMMKCNTYKKEIKKKLIVKENLLK